MGKSTKIDIIVKKIIQAARVYKNNLVGKTFMYVFDNRYIEVMYKASNFKHLTGVDSNLSASAFYQDAVNKRLRKSDIKFSSLHPISNAVKKTNHIIDISTLATSESFMIEDISTQTRSYKFGTTNLDFCLLLNKPTDKSNNPIGKYYIPESFRIEDCFSKSKKQYIVTHIFSKSNASKEYDTLLYMDKGATLCGLPKGIKSRLNSHLQAGEAFVDKCNELFKEVEEIFNENPALYTDFLKLRQNYLNAIGCQPTLPPSNSATFAEVFSNTEKRYNELCAIITYDNKFKTRYTATRNTYREKHLPQKDIINSNTKQQPIKPQPKHKR